MQVKLSFTETLRAGLTSLKIAFIEDLKDEDITNLKPLSRLQVLVVNVRLFFGMTFTCHDMCIASVTCKGARDCGSSMKPVGTGLNVLVSCNF